MSDKTLRVTVIEDTKGDAFDKLGRDSKEAARDVERSSDRVERSTSKMSRALKGIGSAGKGFVSVRGNVGKLAVGIGGMVPIAGAAAAAVGVGLVAALGDFVNEARESRKVGALTEAVIKSTGGSAKITATQVGDLATSISNLTGVDDEAIQSGANLLLTFTQVRNEAGRGNDVFNQTVKLATDMSVALGTDVSKASMQLGKALNDPIKGVTALTRSGVSFTAQQKEQIKSMVESGNVLGAQKLILAEVGKEFGGAAAAASDPLQKLKTVVGNAKEAIGTALLPAVDKAATWLGQKLPGAIKASMEWFGRNKLAIKSFGLLATQVALSVTSYFLRFGSRMALVVAEVTSGLSDIVGGVLDMGIKVTDVLGKLPGKYGQPFRDASAKMREMKANATGALDATSAKARAASEKMAGMADSVDRAGRRVRGMRDEVNRLRGKEVVIRAIDQATRAARAAGHSISIVRGKSVTIVVTDNGGARRVQRTIDNITGRYVEIVVGTRTTGRTAMSEGGTVTGPGPRGRDSEVRILAPGEEVIKTRSADSPGVRAVLKYINRTGKVPQAGTTRSAVPVPMAVAPSGGDTIIIQVTVQGHVLTPSGLAESIAPEIESALERRKVRGPTQRRR